MKATSTRRARGSQPHLSSWIVLATLAACASACAGRPSTRIVENPAGQTINYGAPHDASYVAELDAMQDRARLVVYRSARCDILPVTLMQRYQEKMRGNHVVERTAMSKRQVVGEAKGQVVCDQSYARNVDVMLEVDGGRYPLGKTDAYGTVETNLAQLFSAGSFEQVPQSAKIVLRPAQGQPSLDAGVVSFAQLKRQQDRVAELLGGLEQILAKGETGASADEITRSYELYSQLQELAPNDPRVEAVRGRFWELLYGRKLVEARERMEDNLAALSKAQDTLKVMGDAAIPIYVQAAVNSGVLDRRALEWSSLRLLRALKGGGVVCSSGYAWSQVPSYGWPADVRIAAHYTHFAYGSGYDAGMNHACGAF